MGAIALWVPALLGILAICTESTPTMGSDHTALWVQRLCALTHIRHFDLSGVNYALRKSGHLCGYGALGILLTRIWLATFIKWLRLTGVRLRVLSAISGVISTAVVASLDEFHQSFLPNRSSSVDDVLLDVLGATLLVTAWIGIKLLRWRSTHTGSLWPESYRRREADAQSFTAALPDLANIGGPSFTNASSLVLES